jgi:Tol biopolymer transport system component
MNALLGLLRVTLPLALLISAPAEARLTYVRGDDAIYVARDDGTQPRRVATGIAPTISPDGRWVAYLRPRTRVVEARLVRATGGASRRIARSTEVREIHFTPDSRYVGVALRDRLTLYEIARRRTSAISGGTRGFSFSPDSRSVVWARAARGAEYDDPTDLYSRAIGGSTSTRLTRDRRSRNPLWTASAILFNQQTARGELVLPAYEIHTLERQITNNAVPIDDITYGPVPLALAGTRLLAAVSGQSRYDPYAIDLTTGAARRFEGDDLVPSALSRDGTTVLMQTGGLDPTDRHDVVTVPWEGGTPTMLVRNARAPSWSR